MNGLYGLAWLFSFATFFFAGFLLTRVSFKKRKFLWSELSAINLLLICTLIVPTFANSGQNTWNAIMEKGISVDKEENTHVKINQRA